jgi:hypothetical protein
MGYYILRRSRNGRNVACPDPDLSMLFNSMRRKWLN